MIESYIAKLDAFRALSAESKNMLRAIPADIRRVAPRTDIIRKGEKSDYVFMVVEGWSCEYNIVGNGNRQITGFYLPGDACSQEGSLADGMDHSIRTISDSRLAYVRRSHLDVLFDHHDLSQALWLSKLADLATLRKWIVNLGRRSALERLSHLICELHTRLTAVGLASGNSFPLPLTQEELSDALGLTAVHLNRMFKRLRELKLISFVNQRLEILDLTALRRLAEFDADYLKIRSG